MCVCVCVSVSVCVSVCTDILYIIKEVHTSGGRTEVGVEGRWRVMAPYFLIKSVYSPVP